MISVHAALRQAHARHHSVDEELAALLIHGILHLCGYDHERGEPEARRMRRRELILRRLIDPLPRLIVIVKVLGMGRSVIVMRQPLEDR